MATKVPGAGPSSTFSSTADEAVEADGSVSFSFLSGGSPLVPTDVGAVAPEGVASNLRFSPFFAPDSMINLGVEGVGGASALAGAAEPFACSNTTDRFANQSTTGHAMRWGTITSGRMTSALKTTPCAPSPTCFSFLYRSILQVATNLKSN
jgi:hypothetical protein